MSTFAAEPPTSRGITRGVLFLAVTSVLALGAVHQAPSEATRPQRDDDVVARVPARGNAEVRRLEALQSRADAAPLELQPALALARAYIEASRREGDPRYLGAAEAALARWTDVPDPVPGVRLLRATVLQSRHDFTAALHDLDRVLVQQPGDAQALLTRATVLTVVGRYDEARASWGELAGAVSAALQVACLAPIDAITGHPARATEALEAALSHTRDADELSYLHSLAGEVAYWSGARTSSERHLRAALELAAGDRYTRALYADLLLDAGRAREALSLVQAYDADDALLLRRALAELAIDHRESAAVARVSEGFAASRLRGDSVHQREEARLSLARGDAARALALALQSWTVQHEAWDARLVLEAALQAGQPAAAAPVLAWLDTTHFRAPHLQALATRLRGNP